MSNDARRKERQRLKREKKKQAARRAAAISPYQFIGNRGQLEAAYINADWKSGGLASIQIVRANPMGGHALAMFLVDIWCAGLKDVSGRLDLMRDDIDNHLNRAKERIELERIDPNLARQLVAGGIRFARQNGFKLPAHFDRYVALLGEVGDTANADLSHFGKDGKLLWVGSMEDLGQRLIGCTVPQFLARPDVEFISEVANPEMVEPEVAAAKEAIEESAQKLFDLVVEKCKEKGITPAPRLADAAKVSIVTVLLGSDIVNKREEFSDLAPATGLAARRLLRDVSGNAEMSDDLWEAVQQILELTRGADELNGESNEQDVSSIPQ